MIPDDLKRTFPELAGIGEGGFHLLLEATREVRPAAGDTVIASGTLNDTMYFVCGGSVRVSLESPDECSVLGDFGSGQWIGEMGMLEPAQAAASVVALEDCTLLSLSHDEFMALRRKSPELTSVLLQLLARDLSSRLHATIDFIDNRNRSGRRDADSAHPNTLIEAVKTLLGIAARAGA